MKKKAVIFIEDGTFSYDNRVKREVNALVSAGWDITVISTKFPSDPLYEKVNERLRLYFYPKPNGVSSIGHIVEHTVSLFFGSLVTLWVFFRHGFSVFHACNPMDILWIIAFPYKLLGKKFIFDQHDLCPEIFLSRGRGGVGRLFYRALKILEKASYKFADVVIATNESYREIAITRGGKNTEDVFVVRNGPDLNQFKKVAPRDSIKQNGEVLVGYLGNMNIQDGVDYLLEAANYIICKRKRTDIKFVLIGGAHYQPYLVEQSRRIGLAEYVTFTGRIPDNEMLEILCACDVCVQPDPLNPLNDKSTMNKAMEYMALEKPIVAFDLKETRVSCGDAALYARANDIVEFAEMILYLADNPDLRSKMSRRGRERVEKKLSWDHSIPHLLKAYENVVQK